MDSVSRRLLFRIGTVGFCLNLCELIEIREQASELIDCSQVAPLLSVVGVLSFRQARLPVVDLAGRLGIPSVSPDTILIINGVEESWGLLVDRVEGFFSVADMVDCPVPLLLQSEGTRYFDQIALHAGHPFLSLDLSVCYVGACG